MGYFADPVITANEIKNLVNSKFGTISNTYSNVTSGSDYIYYCYPDSLGLLSNIVMDGAAPILGAFTDLGVVQLTNDGGVNIDYRIYRSNAVNAFTNNTLNFS